MDDSTVERPESTPDADFNPQAQRLLVGGCATPWLTRSYQAFLKELPRLLADHPHEWVAFSGDRELGIRSSKRQLYSDCIAAGHRDGEFLICSIEPPQKVALDDLLEV
jgi:hypothetical protein